MTAKKRTAETKAKSAAGKESGSAPFPIVGIGASAGGLEALERFFKNLPTDSGMAFVVVTHTDPNKTSLLPDIVRRMTGLTVRLIEDSMQAEPDTVYLPPSDRNLIIEGQRFRLRKRNPGSGVHLPVDLFLRHLAEARAEHAACVILSGTGSDGTEGLRAVKEKSGLAVVQAPETAKHAGMPTSAIETGLADFVISPKEMPERLIGYFRLLDRPQADEKKKAGGEPDALKRVIAQLSQRTGHDFSLYKSNTLDRQIRRRIALTRSRDANDYLQLLYSDKREIETLFQNVLIGVTSFFRDPEAFEELKKNALNELLKDKADGSAVRAWVPGCATGEEAFSVAIALKECMQEVDKPLAMQIFGTDIDSRAIEKARNGQYLENIAIDVDPERLKRFFVRKAGGYRVKHEIRESVVFADQDLLRDPPFSDLDLLVCRNLLIYLKTEAQDKLIPLFHYTLEKSGILFLGNAENIARFPELFEPLSRAHSIYRRRDSLVRTQVHFPARKSGPIAAGDDSEGEGDRSKERPLSLDGAIKNILMREYAPSCVLVNDAGEIIYTRGRTGKYLELAPGRPKLSVAEMAREGLRFPLISALRRARETPVPVRAKNLKVRTDGTYQRIDLTVERFSRRPLKDATLVVFQELPAEEQNAAAADGGEPQGQERDRTEELERELLRLRQEYRSAREDLEISNEELRSTNEEMQSSNEELQSTNEELESSREELQSLNEELNTVNDELQNKIEELRVSYNAVTETLDGTRIAIVFLDKDLRIVRFTEAATGLINLIDADLGRPLGHISTNLALEDLSARAARVLDTLESLEEEVRTEDGHWYRMNIMIHRRGDHVIEGVVMTFVNIDPQKKVQKEIEEMKSREVQSTRLLAESVMDTVRESLLVLDGNMRVITANRRFFETFETGSQITNDVSLFELGNGQWDIPELRQLLRQTLEQGKIFEDFLVEHDFPDIGFKRMLLSARTLRDGEKSRILLAIEDMGAK